MGYTATYVNTKRQLFYHNYGITCDKGSWYSIATLLTVFGGWEGVWKEMVVACLEDVYLFCPQENHQ